MGNPPKVNQKKMQNVAQGARKKRQYKKKQYKSIIPTAPAMNQTVKLRYSENIILQTSALVPLVSYVFRINDLYDPNLSGIGHQAYFRDQMYTLYQYARVLWANIKLTLITDTAQVPLLIVLAPLQSVNGNPDTNVQTASERKGSKECYINGQQVKTLSCSSSCDYYFGQTKGATLTDTGFLQNAFASVSNQNAMWYEILSYGLFTTTQNVFVKVDLEQIVRFEQPFQQAGS